MRGAVAPLRFHNPITLRRQAPSRYMNMSLKNRLLAAVLLCFSLSGCLSDDRDMETGTDLAKAEEAKRKHQYGDVEMYLLRYLRTSPEGENRWLVWNNLLDITLHIRQDRRSSRDYLEIMLAEFEDNDEQRRQVQLLLADVCADIGYLERSIQLWEILVEDSGLESEPRAQVYRKLSKAYLRRLEFTVSIDILNQCLTLDISPATYTSCMYDLAETQILTEDLTSAEKTLNELLARENIPEDQAVLAIFMLADVKEQFGKAAEAKDLFESIRDRYPNTKVVDLRISNLTRRNKK